MFGSCFPGNLASRDIKLLNIDAMQISSHIECVYIEIPWGQVSSTAIRVIIYVSNANREHMFELVDPGVELSFCRANPIEATMNPSWYTTSLPTKSSQFWWFQIFATCKAPWFAQLTWCVRQMVTNGFKKFYVHPYLGK